MDEPLEIERKYLIFYPDTALLDSLAAEKWEIRQTYLTGTPEQGSRRVRRVCCGGEVTWYYSEKLRLTDRKRIERERIVSEEEAEELLTLADGTKILIEKTRWRIPFEGKTLEVDVFPFWQRQAFLEIELESEEERFTLPDWVRIFREVTEERRYNNNNLAREIPEEEI